MNLERYSKNFRLLRETNNITQKEMSRILGVSQIAVSQYELGVRQVSVRVLIKYSKYFNVSTDHILGINKTSNNIKK